VLNTSGSARGRTPAQPAGRRPLTRLTAVSLAGHLVFELVAGVGMPLASILGPYAASGVWTLAIGAVWRVAKAGHDADDEVLSAVNGFGVAAVAAHLAGWPTRRTRTGLPWLRECEGLEPELMPYYNSILYFSAAAALMATARENRSAPRHLPLAMLGLVPALIGFQHWEHRRLQAQAQAHHRWWNRRLWRGGSHARTASRAGRTTW
jgi:hypothetical protein